ncbi:N-acyl homoserine lactonase family protein [Desulforhabdus amnigena]|uniref:MBL fold hydrolase n=1 Tax=Desulforhabdus amnigena TaxID=40218 RepID=A0A9W6FSA9_9BACT|nr:N-acyl homoserine lactonase family protein [Desulforhabdus amnigena]GLI34412.1 MBL fold hydrolase [Desulforhabdus amnigena]
MKEYEIYPMVIGANETDQGIMTYLRGYGKRIWIPIYSFLVEGGNEKILVDTGLEQFVVPEHVGREYGLDILEFEDALEKHGLHPEDIDIIIHTHLHNDHCENDYKCPQARIVVQKVEYEFFLHPHPIDHRYYSDLLDGLNVELVEGDTHLMEGIDLIFSPGHTPGGQSVAINTSAGRAIITGFCCNQMNFPPNAPPVPSGVHTDAIAAYESARKIQEMADILIPLHDLSVGSKKRIPA